MDLAQAHNPVRAGNSQHRAGGAPPPALQACNKDDLDNATRRRKQAQKEVGVRGQHGYEVPQQRCHCIRQTFTI